MMNVREEFARTAVEAPNGPHGRRVRLQALDGLRGIMALFVVIYHIQAPLGGVVRSLKTYLPIVNEAWFAVDVFFVMSGFVMMYVYSETFRAAVTWRGYLDFFKARFARLYPVHIFSLVILMLYFVPLLYDKADFLSPDGRYSWTSLVLSFLMLHGPWIATRTWNFPSWSISAEWHAYLLFPFLARFALKWSVLRSGLVIAAGVLIPFVLYLFPAGPERYPTNSLWVLLRVVPLFICGLAVYRLNALLPGRLCTGTSGAAALVVILALGAWTRSTAAKFGILAPGDGLQGWVAFAVAIGISIFLGWLACKFIEEPARALIMRKRNG